MRKFFVFLFSITLASLAFFSLSQKSFAYVECEAGNYTGCNTDGSNTGWTFDVTPDGNGGFTCANRRLEASCVQLVCPGVAPYPECEAGNADACNPNGSQTSHNFSVYACRGTWYCVPDPIPGCDYPVTPTDSSSSPSDSPSPSPAPSSGSTVKISLVVGLQGIGTFGNPPKDSKRSVIVELYDGASTTKAGGPGSQILGRGTGSVNYDSGSDSNAGYFITQNAIPVTLTGTSPSGTYAILVKIPQYLYTLAVSDPSAQDPNAFTFNSGDTITTNPIIMHNGGISGNNANVNSIGVDDYTALKTCFDAHDIASSSCPRTPDGIAYADLDDNGSVDIVDFNILLRTIYQLLQVQGACTGTTCNGD